MSNFGSAEFLFEIAKGNIEGHSIVNKFGRNPDIDISSGFEAVWNGGGDYTGHDPIVAETLETNSGSANDAGTLLSSGTVTGGSATTLIDTSATFSSDGVATGDVIINDTELTHGIITVVTETQLTTLVMSDGAKTGTVNTNGDTYRIVTQASTGTPVVRLSFLLDGSYDNETAEYIILNGASRVDTTGAYIRHSRARCVGGSNLGAINTRQKTTTANVTMVLPISYNTTMIAAYTIPSGKEGFLFDVFAGLSKKQSSFSQIRLMYKAVNDVYRIAEEFTLATTGTSYVPRDYNLPKDAITEMTSIKIMADTSADNMGVAAGFGLVLVDN